MPGCATKGLGCGSRVDPTHPHAPICLSGFSLSPLIPRGWLSHSWSGSGSLSLVSGPFLLTDSADLGPGCFLPGADPRVSLVRAPGSLGLPAADLQNVPHKMSLPEGIRVGTVMRIRGVVPEKAGR